MFKLWRLIVVLVAPALIAGYPVAAAEPTPALKALIEAAQKEGALNLSHGQSIIGGFKGAGLIEEQMNKKFGTSIKINYVPGPSFIRQSQQLLLELSNGQKANTDVFIGWPQALVPLIERDALMEVDWPALLPERIKPALVEGKGKLLQFGAAFPVIVYNTQQAPSVPKTLEDMLRPEWKGKVAASSYLAGLDVLAAKDVWGREKTTDFVQRLSDHAGGLLRCGAEVERVATGEYGALVMDCIGGNTLSWQQRGAPLDFAIPSDAAQLHYYFFSIPKNATYPNAAKLFTVFMMTEEGQKLNWDTWKVDLGLLPGSKSEAIVTKLRNEGVKFTEVTFDWWMSHPEVAEQQDQLLKIIHKK